MAISTLNKGTTDLDTAVYDEEDTESHVKELAQIDGYITECRSIYQNNLISEKTRMEYEKMWAELRAEGRVKEMSENSRFLYETISAAQDYKETFKLQLKGAVKKKWIGKKTEENWMKRFSDPDVLEWDRKKWIREDFPDYLKGWEDTANVRKDVWKLAKKLNVDEKKLPALKGVLKIQDFLSLHFDDRKYKVHAAKAALLALEKNQGSLLYATRALLKKAGADGYMHPSKVGAWMQRVIQSENPRAFFDTVLKPYIRNWKDVRIRFNNVRSKLKKRKDVSRGFKQMSPTKFLLLDYDKRIAYLEEAESRVESDVNEDGPLAKLRLDIRHAMDTGDWKEARLLLEEAEKIDANDKAVRSMRRYLETHRTDENKEGDVEEGDGAVVDKKDKKEEEKKHKGMEALMNLREIMQQLPPNMRRMTEKALNSPNPNTVKRVWQGYYNVHWVMMHGYSTPQMDREQGESEWNKAQTQNRIANGHEWTHERNIIKGSTANSMGIRDDCKKPQQIYTNRTGLTETFKAFERNADNAMFGYWTSIIDDEIPYDSLRDAVTNHMYHIKKNARVLRESGLSYSSHGTPFSNN